MGDPSNPESDEKHAELLPDDHHVPEDKPGTQMVRSQDQLPTRVLALPLNQRPVYPTMMLPLAIPGGRLADGECFAVMAGMGFDAEMLEGPSDTAKKHIGWLAYVGGAVKHVPRAS